MTDHLGDETPWRAAGAATRATGRRPRSASASSRSIQLGDLVVGEAQAGGGDVLLEMGE